MNKYRTRRIRALKQLKNTSAYNLITTEEKDAGIATVLTFIADTMTRELNKSYIKWKVKIEGIDLNDSSEKDSELNEEYKERHDIDTDLEMLDKVNSGPYKQGNEINIALNISWIWKKFVNKFYKTVKFYFKVDTIKKARDNKEKME